MKHVIFGIGPVGRAVMRELCHRGETSIRMVNRSGKATVPAGVEVVKADAYDPAQVQQVTQGASVVYQCAQPGYTEWPTKFPPLQTSIIDGVAASGAKLIVTENLYMYGAVDGPMHEGLPYTAKTRKGAVRAQMAEQLLKAHQQGKVRVAMLRGSDFYGPHVLGSALGERVFFPMLAGKAASLIGDIDQPHSYTFIDDFGKALVIAGENDRALGQAWHVPNAEPTITTRQLLDRAFAKLGKEPQYSSLKKFMLRGIGLFMPDVRELIEMYYEFDRPFVVDSSAFEKAFNMTPTPIDAALDQTLAWFKEAAKSH
jgi:nucleoside-diphosphate-sugar epimerase